MEEENKLGRDRDLMSSPSLALIVKSFAELGGPAIDASDLEWASEIPGGQALLKWLADQHVAPESDGRKDSHSGLNTGTSLEQDLRAALRAVALESDEIRILECTGSTASMVGDPGSDTIHAPREYATPSLLRTNATHLDTETRLLHDESALLQSRLRQTKRASQRTAKTIASLQAALEREDSAIARFHERLAELSVLADTTLSSSTQSALSLLDTLGPATQGDPPQTPEDHTTHPSLASPTRSLTRLADLRAALTEQHTSCVEQLAPSAPTDLLDDATRLSRRFSALLRPGAGGTLEEAAYAVELKRISEALGRDGASLDLILEDYADPGAENDVAAADVDVDVDVNVNVDVRALLEQAWLLDQAAALDAERAALDTTIQAHRDTLLPELEALHTSLSSREQAIRAAEAWVGAFGIEVEGVGSDIADPDPDPDRGLAQLTLTGAGVSDASDAELERDVKGLLLAQHRKHGGGDAAPLVLLERADVVAELRRIREALEENDKGDGWREVGLLREDLGSLDASHHALLDVLYGRNEVQTNATPPFGRSEDVKRLEQRARGAVAMLEAGVAKGEELEKILDGKRTQRKLGEFVHRWTGNAPGGR